MKSKQPCTGILVWSTIEKWKTDYRKWLVYQDLPAEEIKEDLIESGVSEEILQKTCPEEYSGLKEEEVTANRIRNTNDVFTAS